MASAQQQRSSKDLTQAFIDVYNKFKLHFYMQVFKRFEKRESSLSADETFCVEVIFALGQPTISEFAQFMNISLANAAYKVANLERKGYLTKERSDVDRREVQLHLTRRYFAYEKVNESYVSKVAARIEDRFSEQDVSTFKRVLHVIDTELMPEVEPPAKGKS